MICTIYLTQTSQYVDLNMPAGRYKIQMVGAQTLYSAADSVKFTLQFRSLHTRFKYGNAPYLQISYPNVHHSQIQGAIEWEIDYNGPFQMEIIDLTTGITPVGARFSEGTYYFDVKPTSPNQNIKF